jgi:hypothetical protein
MISEGLLELDDQSLRASERGRMLLDSILPRLVKAQRRALPLRVHICASVHSYKAVNLTPFNFSLPRC